MRMRLKLLPAVLLMVTVLCGCQTDCIVEINNRHEALNALYSRTLCATIYTNSSRPHKGKFELAPLVRPQIKGLLVDGDAMPTLKSRLTAHELLVKNNLQLTPFAEICRFISCKTGLLCAFSEYRGSGDNRSVKVTLVWVDAQKMEKIAFAIGVTELKVSSVREDFELYCGDTEKPGDFFDFAALRVVDKMFKQIKNLK